MVRLNSAILNVSIENRMIVDHSFKLGYLFSVTINDLSQILNGLHSGDINRVKSILTGNLVNRFSFMEKHFQKLHFYNSITEDDLKYVIIFLNESKKTLEDAAEELTNTGKLSQEKVDLIDRLVKDMLDY